MRIARPRTRRRHFQSDQADNICIGVLRPGVQQSVCRSLRFGPDLRLEPAFIRRALVPGRIEGDIIAREDRKSRADRKTLTLEFSAVSD